MGKNPAMRSSCDKGCDNSVELEIGMTIINRSMQIIDANCKALQWFPALQLGNKPVCHTIFKDPSSGAPCNHCPTKQVFGDGKVHEAIYQTTKVNRPTRFRIISTPLHNDNGDIFAAAQLIEDITDKQMYEKQMLHSEKMAALGQLAAGMAHEINNPIGFISSNLGTLESYANGLMSLLGVYERSESALSSHLDQVLKVKRDVDLEYIRSDMFELLDESKEGLNRVKKIVQTLKDFSHVDQSGWIVTDLHSELDNTLEILQNQIGPGIQVIKAYGELPLVECQPLEINQVFMNLVQNAVQSIKKEGKIWIRTGIANDNAWVEVADTGCGVPKEYIGRIFDPFFTTKPVGAGTGLGLSLAYSVMEKHHGRIEVHSPQQQGTTFRLWMPLHQPKTV
jgi:signal transduction histidine kinase